MRELRANGFELSSVCEHIWSWRNKRWRLGAEIWDGVAVVTVHRRGDRAYSDALVAEFSPADVDQARAVLLALGVLPSPEERAA
jgi:hypothetical protein